jgi:site-specific recombinase XerD
LKRRQVSTSYIIVLQILVKFARFILSESGHIMNVEKQYRRLVTSARLNPKEVVVHTLRHTAITHLVQAGVDLPTVQRISGDKTLQMVVRYSQ